MDKFILNPIIPIWLMAIICVAMIALKRKGMWSWIRQILIAIILFAINLRPMIPGEVVTVEQQEMNSYVLFVIDDTISMVARDCNDGKSTRLEALKEDCEHIVDSLPGAHFGVIEFHNAAITLSPYTDNGEHIISTIDAIYPIDDLFARGSSLNTPYETIFMNLQEVRKRGDIYLTVIFISDGEITDGSSLASFSPLRQYIDYGVVLGYGTEEGGEMYYKGRYDEEESVISQWSSAVGDYVPALSKLDERNLKFIADDIGGKYIHITDTSQTNEIVNKILNNSEVVTTTVNGGAATALEGAVDIYYWFVIPLAIVLIFEAISVVRRKQD